ncbi:MAG TPA: ABC transporter ATP-binding protein [Deltaproteobacteria bacterium]|nr:ABC transporter ATP-binding protein [Deltaproteobacteria bacterium]
MIAIENATKVYDGGVTALSGVSLRIEKGSCCFIQGPSGAGKTTLLNLIYGLERPSAGSVEVAGINPARASHATLQGLRRHMGFAFQDFKLVETWSAYENTAVVLEMAGKPRSYVRTRVWKVLEWVGLQHRMYERAADLSGGERQRLALARALVHTPEIILADEPVASMDQASARQVMNLIFRMHKRGMTVIIASHGKEFISDGATLIRLDHGMIEGS